MANVCVIPKAGNKGWTIKTAVQEDLVRRTVTKGYNNVFVVALIKTLKRAEGIENIIGRERVMIRATRRADGGLIIIQMS